MSKKPPERPAPPKPTPESTLDKDISTDVPLSTTNSKECEAGTEASVEIDIERRSDQENIASDERGVNPQVITQVISWRLLGETYLTLL